MSPLRPAFAGPLPLAFLLAALCAALPCSFARADAAVPDGPGAPVGSVNLPPGHSAGEVKSALTAAFLGRGWTIKSSGDGAVVGYLNHRGVEAYLTAQYSDSVISFYSQAWKVDRAGVREKPDLPSGWIANIKKDAVKDLEKASGRL
ncbi:MAG TPA: hypothetical protein VHC86_12010 [Opitutaceae bacterium]|nr:hypothetical protein [Opitutaceae bacterium]